MNKANLKSYAPQARKDFIAAVTARANLLVKSLGEALEPVAKRLRRAIVSKDKSSGHEFVIFDDLSRHMGVISQALTHLQPRLSDLIGSAIEDERASTAEAYRVDRWFT